MKWLQRIFLIIGIVCLGLYGLFTVQARIEQSMLEEELYLPRPAHPGPLTTKYKLQEGDLFGRLEVPRLNMSVMVMEGIDDKTLRLGAGHVPDTPLVFAAHRDTFFRNLGSVSKGDEILVNTRRGTFHYAVKSTEIVRPTAVRVLRPTESPELTLITCYPFYYLGSAPKRFIVHAVLTSPDPLLVRNSRPVN